MEMHYPLAKRHHCETAHDVKAAAFAVRENRRTFFVREESKKKQKPEPIIVIPIPEPVVLQPYVPEPPLVLLPPGPDIEAEPEPTIREIQRAVCIVFDLHREDFLSDRRTNDLTAPRHICFTLCRALTTNSLPQIGRAHRGRDHTTVMHGIRKYQWMLDLLRAELTTDQPVSLWAERAKFHYENHPR